MPASCPSRWWLPQSPHGHGLTTYTPWTLSQRHGWGFGSSPLLTDPDAYRCGLAPRQRSRQQDLPAPKTLAQPDVWMRETTFNSVQCAVQKITTELLPLNPSAAASPASAASPTRCRCLRGVWAAACARSGAESTGAGSGSGPQRPTGSAHPVPVGCWGWQRPFAFREVVRVITAPRGGCP